jgi:MBG domain (YGX type)
VAGGPYAIRQGTVHLTSDYDLHYVGANLTISRAPLPVTVLNAPPPALTGTINGIKFSDNISATYATTATVGSPVGSYPITATLVDPDAKLANYTVTNNPGT